MRLLLCAVLLWGSLGPGAAQALAKSVAVPAGASLSLGATPIAGAAASALSVAPVMSAQTSLKTAAPLAHASVQLGRGAEPSLTLNALFSASRRAAPAAEPVGDPGTGSSDGPGLDPWSGGGSRGHELAGRAVERLRQIPHEVRVGVTIAVVIAAVLGGFYKYSSQLNEFWVMSKSAAQVEQIDEARREGDAPKLLEIAKSSHERGDRMETRIATAEKAGAKRVENRTNDSVRDAKRYLAFDRVVETRAELNHNAVTKDENTRIGKTAPDAWRARVGAEEAAAKESGFEGTLATTLRSMNAEIGAQKAKAGALEQHVDNFGKVAPTLFGGELRAQHQKGAADLQEFRTQEMAPEENLHSAANAAMRGRVGERLYSERQDYRDHRDRRDRLSKVYDQLAKPAVAVAEQVDAELRGMISARNTEAAMLTLAALHTNDAEYYTDTDGKQQVRYVDNSGPYRLAASVAASQAQAHARDANAALQRLRPMVTGLHNNRTLQDEGLVKMLPKAQGREVYDGHGLLTDWFLPPLWGIFSGLSNASSAERARTEFAPIKSALERTGAELSGRRDGETRWLDHQVDQDLESQIGRAGNRA
ncbi:MAG: hypothetical protein HY553_01815 [Elusimicrobia bacterium]|nr:hypothetical protein [Elusimicrobiota bacterium]